jgi:uncharacterized protein YdeI (YjbR/CyaY-like superfamily)
MKRAPWRQSSRRQVKAVPKTPAEKPLFFATPAKFRAWLEKNHTRVPIQWVGFYRKASGRPSITWPESVDQALCFGWIDGLRKGIDGASYKIRFTPRKPGSTWSAINIRRAKELSGLGLMTPAGLRAFEKRTSEKSAIYSYEQRRNARFSAAQEKQFRANRKAWDFFRAQPPWYQRVTAHWVTSAKKEETQAKRLATLISDSAAARTIGPLTRKAQK